MLLINQLNNVLHRLFNYVFFNFTSIILHVTLSNGYCCTDNIVNYKPLPINVAIKNPERGFYIHTETPTPLDLNTLNEYKTQNITLILRLFYLNEFLTSPISSKYLKSIQYDLDIVRTAGLKAIVRFAYSKDNNSSQKLNWDASKSQILFHLSQLKQIFVAYEDVIVVVQTGFVGVWGEWFYTNNFGHPEQNTIDNKNRKEVVESLLDKLPSSRFIQFRTPLIKTTMYGSNALKQTEAFKQTNKARIGFHNDCFLSDYNDSGAYVNINEDNPYLEQETRFTPMGGETWY